MNIVQRKTILEQTEVLCVVSAIAIGSMPGCGSQLVSTGPTNSTPCLGVPTSQLRAMYDSLENLRDGGMSKSCVMREVIGGCSTTACRCVSGIIEDVYAGRSYFQSDSWSQPAPSPSSPPSDPNGSYSAVAQINNSNSLIATLPGSYLWKSADQPLNSFDFEAILDLLSELQGPLPERELDAGF